MRRGKSVLFVVLALGLVALVPAQALAGGPGTDAAKTGGALEAVVARADAQIFQAVKIAQLLAERTPLDDAAIAAWLVSFTTRIAEKTAQLVGAENLEFYSVLVQVGDVTVEIDPMKVAGE